LAGARIFYGNRAIHIGYFETREEAILARDRRKRKLAQQINGEGDASLGSLSEDSDRRFRAIKFQKLEAEAEREAFTNSVLKSEYVRIDDVMITLSTLLTEVKNKLLGFPALITPLILGQADQAEVIRIMEEHLSTLLNDLKLDQAAILLRSRPSANALWCPPDTPAKRSGVPGRSLQRTRIKPKASRPSKSAFGALGHFKKAS
jgi:hypothetical protein